MPFKPIDTHKTHSYIRSHYTDDKTKMVWKCAHPHCTHTLLVPKRDRSIIIGRATICPECQETEFILTSEDIKRKIPKCQFCRSTGKAKTMKAAKSVMEGLLKDIF